MKINGWWLACGLLSLSDYIIFSVKVGYNWTWVQMITLILVFIGFGLTFENKTKSPSIAKENQQLQHINKQDSSTK